MIFRKLSQSVKLQRAECQKLRTMAFILVAVVLSYSAP